MSVSFAQCVLLACKPHSVDLSRTSDYFGVLCEPCVCVIFLACKFSLISEYCPVARICGCVCVSVRRPFVYMCLFLVFFVSLCVAPTL